MLVPIGDDPRPPRAPLTWTLIAVDLAVFVLLAVPLMREPAAGEPLAQAYVGELLRHEPHLSPVRLLEELTRYDLLLYRHGYRPAAPSPLALLASLFLHAGWLHLAGNLLFLWIFGPSLERRLGVAGFLALYLATGAAATGLTGLVLDTPQPLVGASGAIAGLLGAYFLLLPASRVKVLLALPPFYMKTVPVPARWVLGFYVVVQNFVPLLLGDGGPVAHGVHLAGFAAGLAAGALALPTHSQP
jgi:membrane associated rhomboid family serine protease